MIRGGKSANGGTMFYKSDDESSLELGEGSDGGNGKNVKSISQENLTAKEVSVGSMNSSDIRVHTLVEVVSGRHHV